MSSTHDELVGTCNTIVHEVEAAVDGCLYKVDGEIEIIVDLDEWKQALYDKKVDAFKATYPDYDRDLYDSYDEYVEDECGTVDDIDDPEEVTLADYLADRDLGDVRFEVDSSKDLLGGKLLVAYGGPNIWISDEGVTGYWGSETVERTFHSDARGAVFDWFANQWSYIE